MSGPIPTRPAARLRLVVASGWCWRSPWAGPVRSSATARLILALLMYLPLVPIGLAAVGFDAICRGGALPRGRFVLGAIGLVAALGAAWPMVGLGPLAAMAATAR